MCRLFLISWPGAIAPKEIMFCRKKARVSIHLPIHPSDRDRPKSAALCSRIGLPCTYSRPSWSRQRLSQPHSRLPPQLLESSPRIFWNPPTTLNIHFRVLDTVQTNPIHPWLSHFLLSLYISIQKPPSPYPLDTNLAAPPVQRGKGIPPKARISWRP